MGHSEKRNTVVKLSQAHKKIAVAAEDIQLNKAFDSHNISYITKLLALVSLPYKNQSTSQYQRRNGNQVVTFTNTTGGDLPYGRYPRLIIIWLITQVMQKQTQVVDLGDSLNQFMKVFGLSTDGGTMARFKKQAINLLDTNINITQQLDDGDHVGYLKSDLKITSKSVTFWSKRNPNQLGLFGIELELTTEFYNDIINTAFPIDTRAVKALTRNISLDLYIFLASRIFRLNQSKKPEAYIPIADLQLHIGSNYRNNKSGRNDFQKDIKTAMIEIATLWPALQYELLPGRLLLKKSPTHIAVRKGIEIVDNPVD